MSHPPLFYDREDAGNQLAQAVIAEMAKLDLDQSTAHPVVYALPKGGLPVAEPIARLLHCPLDVLVAKKVTRPENPELAIGAVTADGFVIRSCEESLMQWSRSWQAALQRAQSSADAQRSQFAASYDPIDPKGTIAILVDDGIATGMTIAVAARALRSKQPDQIFICSPVAPKRMLTLLEQWGDRIIVLAAPESFLSVSRFYASFEQVEIEEAIACLERVRCGEDGESGEDEGGGEDGGGC